MWELTLLLRSLNDIEKRVAKDKYLNTTELNKILQEEIENCWWMRLNQIHIRFHQRCLQSLI